MASVYPPVVQRLFTDSELARIEQARRPALLMHAPTRFVREAEVEAAIRQLFELNPNAEPEVIFADPGVSLDSFLDFPTRRLPQADPDRYDVVVIASALNPELFYKFFLASPLRWLPVIAPRFPGKTHRMFIHEIMGKVAPDKCAGAVEVGCIESIEGGSYTTLALAESVGDGFVTSIDVNPYSISIAKYFCRGHDHALQFHCGDVFEVLPTLHMNKHVHIFIEHIWSDNAPWLHKLIKLYEATEAFLAEHCAFLFLSADTWQENPDSFQSYLAGKGFTFAKALQETSSPRNRFLLAMLR